MSLELFWRFLTVGLLAFGGGQAALPLVERIGVAETGWVTSQDFATAVAFSYVTPGPVLILATFIGYRAGGLEGAVAATVGVFLMPWLLAAAAAQHLQRLLQHPWLWAFGRAAGPAVVGLLGVTALDLARHTFAGWVQVGIASVCLTLALSTKVHPFWILIGGGMTGTMLESASRLASP